MFSNYYMMSYSQSHVGLTAKQGQAVVKSMNFTLYESDFPIILIYFLSHFSIVLENFAECHVKFKRNYFCH